MTDDYTILRVGRLAIVTPLGQFFYLTSEPEDGITLSLQHWHDVLMTLSSKGIFPTGIMCGLVRRFRVAGLGRVSGFVEG